VVSVGMLSWVLTYLVHSTVLIVLIWAVTTFVPRTPLSLKETLWKVALLGGIFTASLQMAAGVGSPWGDLEMPRALGGEKIAVTSAAGAAKVETPRTVEETRRVYVHENGGLRIHATRERKATPAAAVISAPSHAPALPGPWRFIVLGLLGAGSLFAVARLLLSARRLRAQLRSRRDVIEDPVLESFLNLCQKAELKRRPRLTASPHLRSPVALPGHEICLPERAVDSLTPPQQEGMLAHEIAHLVRRDPAWQIIATVVEAIFFFQPLNHLARRKMQETAEFQCDDWAARHTGSGVHLAKCLAEVAGWVEEGPPASPLASAMAGDASPIVRRIKRLLHDGRRMSGTHPVARVGSTLAVLGLVTWLAPGVGVAQANGTAPESTTASAQAATPSPVAEPRIAFLDLEDDERHRSRVRFESGDDVVEIEVDTPRAAAPVPLPAPPPERDSGSVNIVIQGQMWGGPFGCCGAHGFIGIDLDGMDLLLEGLLGDPWDAHARAEAARERAAAARLRAEEARDRAYRHAERVRERLERDRERFERDAQADDDDDDDGGWFSLMRGREDEAPPPPSGEIIEL
jgi:beta-lactamase regulating signal transducer with metallopeptidase domain